MFCFSRIVAVGVLFLVAVSGQTRYFLGSFDSTVYAFPIDKCVATSTSLTSSFYSCSEDGSTVTETTYSDFTCGSVSGSNSWNSSNADFECTGDDNYVEFGIFADDATCSGSPYLSLYSAVDVCESSTFTQATCSGSTASITTYTDNTCGTLSTSTDISSCEYYGTVLIYSFYYEVTKCAISSGSNTPTEPASTMDNSNNINGGEGGENGGSGIGTITITTDVRYFIGEFQGYSYPFPIDVCVVTALGSEYAMFTCSSDGSTVTEDVYSDSACAGTSETNTYTSSDAQFNCDGYDSYGSLNLYLDASCGFLVGTLYSSLSLCVQIDTENYFSLTCDDTSVTILTFTDSDCTTLAADGTAYVNGCTFYDTIDYEGSAVSVYYEIDECNAAKPTTPTPIADVSGGEGGGESGSDANVTKITFIAILMFMFVASVMIV